MHHVKLEGYGGGMIWAVDLDDFNGVCGEKWPLLNAMKAGLKDDGLDYPLPSHPEIDFVMEIDGDPDSTDASDVFDQEPILSEEDQFECPENGGQHPLPNSCNKFAICQNGELLHVQVELKFRLMSRQLKTTSSSDVSLRASVQRKELHMRLA